jgi:hypothetical protein
MQSDYPAHFERDMGCTEPEWLGWLPAAMGDVVWQRHGPGLTAQLASGRLRIDWYAGAPRVIALMRIPRLHVRFDFDQVSDDERHRFMKRFDLYMQRGGG